MTEDHILYSVEGHRAMITLNRPEAKNAFSPEMIRLWRQCLEEARRDDRVRVVVITGRGTRSARAAISGIWSRGNNAPGT
jgi:enoyl-CoA hydratase/carnithine racemase